MPDDLDRMAEDLSRVMEPPRWRILRHRFWRKHQQPEDVYAMLWTSIRGEYEPIVRYGFRV